MCVFDASLTVGSPEMISSESLLPNAVSATRPPPGRSLSARAW
jgi:hypothetical protein